MHQPEIEKIGDDLYFVTATPATRRLRTQVELLSQTDVPVLITGEAGSGKATVARVIHSLSLRSSFPFVKVDCGALTPDLLGNDLFGAEYVGVGGRAESVAGKFEQSARGTVLLEEFDATNGAVQARILKLLERRELVRCGGQTAIRVDVRIFAAMERGLEAALAQTGAVHELYHRLSVCQLQVPPLRERQEEIPLLLGHFMNRLTRHYGVQAPHFSSRLLEACQHHAWPGNLRELENFVKRFLALGDEQAALDELNSHASMEIVHGQEAGTGNGLGYGKGGAQTADEKSSLKLLLRNVKGEAERHAIAQALDETHWNRKAASRLLNISYRGLLYKIQEYHLVPPGNGFATNGVSPFQQAK